MRQRTTPRFITLRTCVVVATIHCVSEANPIRLLPGQFEVLITADICFVESLFLRVLPPAWMWCSKRSLASQAVLRGLRMCLSGTDRSTGPKGDSLHRQAVQLRIPVVELGPTLSGRPVRRDDFRAGGCSSGPQRSRRR